MAAFGTVKPGFEKAAQLQFPQQFSREFARRQLGLRYAPNDAAPVVQDYVGDDFFADYHAQKRADSQRAVMTGVADTRRSVNRAMVSHAGYFGLPEPVRHQRRIGADVGVNIGANSYFGPSPTGQFVSAALEGGVIGSREGRMFIKDALQRRIAQFDAIDASVAEGPTVQAAVEVGIEPGQQAEIEANTMWQRILGAVRAGQFYGMIALLPRALKALTEMFSIPENLAKLDDYQSEITDALEFLRSRASADRDEFEVYRAENARVLRGEIDQDDLGDLIGQKQIATLLPFNFLSKALQYLNIIGNETQKGVPTLKGLKALSRAAAKTAGFGKLRIPGPDELLSEDSRAVRVQEKKASERGLPTTLTGNFGRASFTPDGVSYEVSNGPSLLLPMSTMADTNRNDFGRQGQRGEFRGERSFFGEDTDTSNIRPGIQITEEVPRGFTRIIQDQGTDADSKEDDETGALTRSLQAREDDDDDEDKARERVREKMMELGLFSLRDIEEAVDEMPAEQGRVFLNRIATQLRSASAGRPVAVSKSSSVADLKRTINQLLSMASG
jgi:hypothetical protein